MVTPNQTLSLVIRHLDGDLGTTMKGADATFEWSRLPFVLEAGCKQTTLLNIGWCFKHCKINRIGFRKIHFRGLLARESFLEISGYIQPKFGVNNNQLSQNLSFGFLTGQRPGSGRIC